MKIAVNVQTLIKNKMEGLGWFTYETIKRIVKANPQHQFTFIFSKGIEKDFIFAPNVTAVNIGFPFFHPLVLWINFSFLIPLFVNKNKFDLYLSPDGFSSKRIKTKTVIVVHDINFEHFPKFLPKNIYWYYKIFFPKWINKADSIATVSNYSKQDIIDTYKISPDKIDVMYNGAGDIYKPITEQEKIHTKNKYTHGNDYFIFVGALHPRKNITNMLKAFEQFKNNNNNIKFVIVGERFYWSKEMEKAYSNMQFKNDVIFTGRLTPDKLKYVMGASISLVYVSLFEGFGIPIIEAMNCNIPVITSNTTSMPEVAGKGALIVDPYDIKDISKAMAKIVKDEKLRNKLIYEGQKQKEKFNWGDTAQKLWKTVEKVL